MNDTGETGSSETGSSETDGRKTDGGKTDGGKTGTRRTLERVGWTVAFLLLGLLGTLAVALALLRITVPVQRVVYGALYLRLGPSEATETATLFHFLGIGVVAIAVPMVLGDLVSTWLAGRDERVAGHDELLANRDGLLAALAVLVGLLVVFVAVAMTGFAATPVAFLLLALALLGIPLLLRYRFGVRSGAVPAFVGGIPVLVLLLLLVGFGLGWGWGYTVDAREILESSVGDREVVTLSDAPAVEAALFDADNCETDADGFRTCYLSLRGFEHERAAVRALADHGVRCPYQSTGRDGGTAIVRHEGRYYEVGCSPHGD